MKTILVILCGLLFLKGNGISDDTKIAIEIQTINQKDPIDFTRSIAPILIRNCTACHNEVKAKSGLNLETPDSIRNGGDSGPSIIVEHPEDSLLLMVASHRMDPFMPPENNNVNASNLTPEELGLLRLWIMQGAKGKVDSLINRPIEWQPLVAEIQPIYSVALSENGRIAASGTGNQIRIYDLKEGTRIAQLSDPKLTTLKNPTEPVPSHLDIVQSLAFSSTGLLASGGFRTVKLWEAIPQPVLIIQEVPLNKSTTWAMDPSGEFYALARADGSIEIWNIEESGQPERVLTGSQLPITAVQFSNNSGFLLASSQKGVFRKWNLQDGNLLAEWSTDSPILGFVYWSTSEIVIWRDSDHNLFSGNLPESANGEPVQNMNEIGVEAGPIIDLQKWHPEESGKLLVGFKSGKLQLRQFDNPKLQQEWNHEGELFQFSLNPDGSRIVSLGVDQSMLLWDAVAGNKITNLKGSRESSAKKTRANFEFSRAEIILKTKKKLQETAEKKWQKQAENTVTTATKRIEAEKNHHRLLDTMQRVEETKTRSDARISQINSDLESFKKNLIDSGDQPQKWKALIAHTEMQLKSSEASAKEIEKQIDKARSDLEKSRKEWDKSIINSELSVKLADRYGSEYIHAKAASAEAEAQLKENKADLEIAIKNTDHPTSQLQSFSFSIDSKTLATSNSDGQIQLWACVDGEPLQSMDSSRYGISEIHFTGNDQLLLLDESYRLFKFPTRLHWILTRTIGHIDDPELLVDRVTALDFSPDGKLLATGGGWASRSGELKLWNVSTGQLIRTFKDAHSDTLTGIRFSPNGQFLATSSTDRFMKVFKVKDGSFVRSFEGHTHHVTDVAWNPDGHQLATAGADQIIKIWNFKTGEQKKTIQGYRKQVTSLHYVGLTDQLFTTSGSPGIRLGEDTLKGAPDFTTDSAINRDGQVAVTGGIDGVLRVWNVPEKALRIEFKVPSSKNLTASRPQ